MIEFIVVAAPALGLLLMAWAIDFFLPDGSKFRSSPNLPAPSQGKTIL
jgi:hypothetical protein